jgi:hypothetical protein
VSIFSSTGIVGRVARFYWLKHTKT